MTLARDLSLCLDPALMMARCGLEADPWQASVMRSTAPRMMLLCTRQAGKSTVAAAMALHQALMNPGALVLLLSPSMRQSQELFRKVMSFVNAMGDVSIDNESALRLELAGGSRIVSLPGTEETIRGYSGVAFLVIDEAARVQDELYVAVRPMLAVSGGRMVALSTPFGRRGGYHRDWTEGVGWERVRVTADDCARISADFLAQERASLGQWAYSQEYDCEFVDTDGAAFGHDLVRAALTHDASPLFAEARPW